MFLLRDYLVAVLVCRKKVLKLIKVIPSSLVATLAQSGLLQLRYVNFCVSRADRFLCFFDQSSLCILLIGDFRYLLVEFGEALLVVGDQFLVICIQASPRGPVGPPLFQFFEQDLASLLQS